VVYVPVEGAEGVLDWVEGDDFSEKGVHLVAKGSRREVGEGGVAAEWIVS
jgi:hypothetical protein